jgi:hypothetical protein
MYGAKAYCSSSVISPLKSPVIPQRAWTSSDKPGAHPNALTCR